MPLEFPWSGRRAMVDVVRKSRDAQDLATKGDIREVEHKIEVLCKDMQAMEQRLIIKLPVIMVAAVGLMGAVTALVSRLA